MGDSIEADAADVEIFDVRNGLDIATMYDERKGRDVSSAIVGNDAPSRRRLDPDGFGRPQDSRTISAR